jgi:hypothetical protein
MINYYRKCSKLLYEWKDFLDIEYEKQKGKSFDIKEKYFEYAEIHSNYNMKYLTDQDEMDLEEFYNDMVIAFKKQKVESI